MKLIEYPYVAGEARTDIIMGGMFPHYQGESYLFVGCVQDVHEGVALTRAYLLTVIHEVRAVTEEVVPPATSLDGYLAALSAAGYQVTLPD